jgi:predicted lipoprotein with Yx(FWY)xxD motif
VTAGLGLGAGLGTGLALTSQAAPAGATSSHAKTITVSTTSVSHIGTVLTTASGLTLYRFTKDPAGGSTCTGACAKIWPPLLAAKGTHVKGPKGLKGLSLIKVGNGHWQVAFHNVALYRFEGDKKKGQAKGQAIAGEWFAVLKSGLPASGAAAHASSSSTSTSAPTTVTTQPPTSPPQGAPGPTPSSPPVSQMPATQSTSPPPPPTTPPTSPPPTTTPPTSPPPTTTPTTTGGGGYGY